MKVLQFSIAIASWAALARAVPILESRTTPPKCTNLKPFTDNFDKRTVVPVSLSGTSAVGVEGGLNYKVFNVAKSTATLLLSPPSRPNFAFAGLVGQVTNGNQPQFLPASPSVKYFNLESIAVACAVNSGVLPVTCTIHVAGKKAQAFGGGSVDIDLIYNPGPAAPNPLKSYSTKTFPKDDWTGLVEVSFSIIQSPNINALTNLLIDDNKYQACFA